MSHTDKKFQNPKDASLVVARFVWANGSPSALAEPSGWRWRESNDRGIINLDFSYNPIIYNVRHVLEIERHLEWNHW